MSGREASGRFSALPVALGAVGYLLALLILIVSDRGAWSEQVAYLFRDPKVAVWANLIAVQFGACSALMPALVASLREPPALTAAARKRLRSPVAIAIILFLLFLLGHRAIATDLQFPVHHQRPKVIVLTTIMFVPFLISLYGMCSIALKMEESLKHDQSASSKAMTFLALNRTLQWYLLIAGMLVGGATLITGALQSAIASLNRGASLNPSIILLYGLFGSAVIVLYYVPIHAAAQSAGRSLCATLLPMQEGEGFIPWLEARAKLEASFGLNRDWADSLRTGLVLLAPLAGSALSLLIGRA